MTRELTKLSFSIGAGPMADAEKLAELTQQFQEDLVELGSVEHVRGGEAPAKSKGDAITLATLAVALAPTALTGLINILQSWLTRHERTSITLKKGEEVLTLTGTLSKDQQQVIADWLHAGKAS